MLGLASAAAAGAVAGSPRPALRGGSGLGGVEGNHLY